jgi:nucleotide-binding universal stress UspA family protein
MCAAISAAAEMVTRNGHPAREILELEKAGDVTEVVMGSHG